jgi:acetylornithine/succinyldiaminopimelate/putrescine aminotransferase
MKKRPVIKEIRGKGLILGIEMTIDVADVIKACMEKGLLAASAGPNVLRLVPPLIIGEADVDAALEILDAVLEGR